MVRGIESFREWFRGYEEQYAIIGGTACDLLMTDRGLDFRATKDIDLVLIIEAMDAAFGRKFWEYVMAAGYEHQNKSTGDSQFYRFMKPRSGDYPTMIELFTKKPDSIILPENALLSPLPMEEDISSLSAILLDEGYYEFLRRGRIQVSGVTVLDAPYLIPFKAKAWIDLSDRNAEGKHVDSRNLRKHKNDVFRLTELLEQGMEPLPYLPDKIKADMKEFIKRMLLEEVDLKQIGIRDKSKAAILEELKVIYG